MGPNSLSVCSGIIQVLNIAIYPSFESKKAHTKVRPTAGLNDETVRLRSRLVFQPRAAALECVRGCVTVTHNRGNSNDYLAAAKTHKLYEG